MLIVNNYAVRSVIQDLTGPRVCGVNSSIRLGCMRMTGPFLCIGTNQIFAGAYRIGLGWLLLVRCHECLSLTFRVA